MENKKIISKNPTAYHNYTIEDTIEKLRGLWITKKLSDHIGVTSLTKVLYGGTK